MSGGITERMGRVGSLGGTSRGEWTSGYDSSVIVMVGGGTLGHYFVNTITPGLRCKLSTTRIAIP